mmetsp:Transcript_51902/g.86260  ORF Transcript_51902/g.86260 Transcript_51902/m.86260 type:complete len:99 (-) Transcript_51902:1128-1424(-)
MQSKSSLKMRFKADASAVKKLAQVCHAPTVGVVERLFIFRVQKITTAGSMRYKILVFAPTTKTADPIPSRAKKTFMKIKSWKLHDRACHHSQALSDFS